MNKLSDFLKNNEITIGKDFMMSPPAYYSSLKEAYFYYFSTFKHDKDSFHFILSIDNWNEEGLGSGYSSGAMEEICFSILNFHRFFELFIKEILSRIDPFLSVKMFEKEEEIFRFLNNSISTDEIKTIEFSDAIKRLRFAFNYYSEESIEYREVLIHFKFLKEKNAMDALDVLSQWRNRIMHNGKTFPNLFAFDYLISQEITPIIYEIINTEVIRKEWGNVFLFTTPTGINVIDEILKVKFKHQDFNNIDMKNKLAHSFFKLAHLKEIGKASFKLELNTRSNIHHYEPYYENPIGRVERFAESEKKCSDYLKSSTCICCGLNSLVVYQRKMKHPFSKEVFQDEFVTIEWFKCYNCEYALKNNITDAHYFGISDTQYFTYDKKLR